MKLAIIFFVLLLCLNIESFAYGKCSFLCERIPADSEVLSSIGADSNTNLNKKFKVLAWNIYKGRQPGFAKAWQSLTKDKDIVLLSEATNGSPIKEEMEKMKGWKFDLAAVFEMKRKVIAGVAVGSRARTKNVWFYRTEDIEPLVKSPKTIILAEYKINGSDQTLLAASIHGINWDGDDALKRQLLMVLPKLISHKGPIVFAGDFNTKNENRLNIAKEILGKAGLQRVQWQNPMKKKQLDDAFTRGLVVASAKLVHDYVDKGSDHPAIELELEFK